MLKVTAACPWTCPAGLSEVRLEGLQHDRHRFLGRRLFRTDLATASKQAKPVDNGRTCMGQRFAPRDRASATRPMFLSEGVKGLLAEQRDCYVFASQPVSKVPNGSDVLLDHL